MAFPVIFAIFGAAPASASGFALVINPSWNWTTSYSIANQASIESTVNTAIGIYEAQLTTATTAPVQVNITFGDSTTSLGSTNWTPYSVTYQAYVDALTTHSSLTADDMAALSHLPTGAVSPITNTSGDAATSVFIKSANMKALGMTFMKGAPATDATIGVETSLTNLSRTGMQDPSKYDLQTVLMHEIDEALGLGSSLGVDLANPSPEDFFRYQGTRASGTQCSSVDGRSTLSTADTSLACFSIDASSGLAQFNQNGAADYGDWVSSGTARVQDAFGTPGMQSNLGVEWRALDVIGYNLAVTAAPEPSTGFLLISATCCLMAFRRRA